MGKACNGAISAPLMLKDGANVDLPFGRFGVICVVSFVVEQIPAVWENHREAVGII